MLNGEKVGGKLATINNLIDYYNNNLKTVEPTNNTNISYPSVNPYDLIKKDNDDGVEWRDGKDMESADELLQQKYHFESKLRKIIKESVRQVLKNTIQ